MSVFKRFEFCNDPKVEVKDIVLFGDLKDVRLKNAGVPNEKSQGGTIIFTLKRSTRAMSGDYIHGKLHIVSGGDNCWVHVVYHESINGEKLGKLMCTLRGYHDLHKDNVWSRYDWCHYRNWGDYSGSEEDDCENDDEHDSWSEENDNNEDNKDKKLSHDAFENENKGDRKSIFFRPVAGKGYFKLDPSCILGDWYYGVRLTDPKTKLSYAYAFGDAFCGDEFYCDKADSKQQTDFNIDPSSLLLTA